MDAFNTDAFSLTSLSGAVDKMDYVPQLLGSLNLFQVEPVRTRTVFVDRREGVQTLIQTSADGAPLAELAGDGRDATPLKAVRLAKGATITASEIASWRAFGSESENTVVMQEYNRRMQKVRNDMELTHELHRLGAIQGKLLDADGSTIYNYFTEFGESEAAAVSFELDVDTTDVRTICNQIVRAMARSAKGAFTASTTVHALAGDTFYDELINHPSVRNTYLNYSAAADLRDGTAFGAFTFGGITFHNYRGTDDGSDVAVATSEVKLFPVGAQDVFVKAQAPADEFMPYVGAAGQNIYSMNLRDPSGRDAWVRNEQYSYPLYICQRPEVLRKGTLT
jgi:hypothetical protein